MYDKHVLNLLVFPAHAGVILHKSGYWRAKNCISRTCGGDPILHTCKSQAKLVFPAHAGVILSFTLFTVVLR